MREDRSFLQPKYRQPLFLIHFELQKAAEELRDLDIKVTIVDARFAKPLDEKLIFDIARNHEALITIEEGVIGGFGSHVAQFLFEKGIFDTGLKYRSMTFPDLFIDQATPEEMYDTACLSSTHIKAKVIELLGKQKKQFETTLTRKLRHNFNV